MKINEVIAICLLKMNNIIEKGSHQIIYRAGEEMNCMYIILYGKAKLTLK